MLYILKSLEIVSPETSVESQWPPGPLRQPIIPKIHLFDPKSPFQISSSATSNMPEPAEFFLTTRVEPVALASLTDDERECTICYLEYGVVDVEGGDSEQPIRMRSCGHVFGERCLGEHIRGSHVESNKCPECRTLLFRGASFTHINEHIVWRANLSRDMTYLTIEMIAEVKLYKFMCFGAQESQLQEIEGTCAMPSA